MKITWDEKVRAVYIFLKESEEVARTVKISDALYIDYKEGDPVGIEILNVGELPFIEQT